MKKVEAANGRYVPVFAEIPVIYSWEKKSSFKPSFKLSFRAVI